MNSIKHIVVRFLPSYHKTSNNCYYGACHYDNKHSSSSYGSNCHDAQWRAGCNGGCGHTTR